MNSESPKANKILNPTQNGMRFLKRNVNPASKGNEEGSNMTEEQPCPQEKLGPGSESHRFGQELAPDAEIWKMYFEEAQEHDREVFEVRKRDLDTLLLFAVLLSIMLTVFLLESNKMLRQDPADAFNSLLSMISQSQKRIELAIGHYAPVESTNLKTIFMLEFTPPTFARWINRTWFMSLLLSLLSAMLAMLGKERLAHLHSLRPQSPTSLPHIRQSISRIKRLEDWDLLRVIGLIPTLLHTSLFLLLAGLVQYMWAFDTGFVAIFAGAAGVAFCFYSEKSVFGALRRCYSFATGVSQCVRTIMMFIFANWDKDARESITPSIQDLQALVWLSKRSVNPIVVDSAYQAMAGLQQSPYTAPDLALRRPSLHSDLMASSIVSVFGRGEMMDSLLLQIHRRFDELLAGILETSSLEPPVCRYINAMIAIGHCAGKSTDAPLRNWLHIWGRIDRLWGSDLPEQCLSGNSFTGVLIAEMDVLKLVINLIQPDLSKAKPRSSKEANVVRVSERVMTKDQSSMERHPQETCGLPSGALIDTTARSSLLRAYNRLEDWIEASLTLLQSHDSGEVDIDPYLVNGLFRAMSDGAYYLKSMYSVLDLQDHINSASNVEKDGKMHKSLEILIFLLSKCAKLASTPLMRPTEILKTYSHLVPLVFRLEKQQDESGLMDLLKFSGLDSSSMTSRSEILGATMHHMMPLTAYISELLPNFPQYQPLFNNAVSLTHTCTLEDANTDDSAPRQALRHHIDHYIKLLEFIGASKSNFDSITELSADYICLIATQPIRDDIHPNGLYLPPSCFHTLLRLFARTLLNERGIYLFLETIMKRLRNPSVSLTQLPPQSSPIPEPSTSIEYLRQITWLPGGFSAFVQAGSADDYYAKSVYRTIADITIIAANLDSTLTVEPVELREPAVPGFLEALTWTLPRLSESEEEENVYNRFVVATSVLLVAACEDLDSRDLIYDDLGRTRLLGELRTKKSTYVGIIGEGEWERLVDGLNMGDIITEEAGGSNDGGGSDGEQPAEPFLFVNEATESSVNSDSESEASVENFL